MSDPNTPQPGQQPTPPAGAVPPPAQPTAPPPPAAAPQQPTAPPPPQQPAAPQYQAAPQGGAQPLSADSDRQAAMWGHIGGIVGPVPVLIIWLMMKDRGPRVAVEGKEALNWQISFVIIYVAAIILQTILSAVLPMLFFVWALVPLAAWVLNAIWSIMGGMKVNGGGSYRYPINFRFIK